MRIKSISVILIAFIACNNQDPCRHPAGHKSKEIRQLPKYHHIKVQNHIPISVIQSNFSDATIYADDGSIPFLKTEVRNDTLFIWNNNRCSWLRHYDQNISIALQTSNIESIIQEGSADISLEGKWKLPKLNIHTIHYSGNINFQDIDIDSLKFYEKVSGSCHLKLKGAINYGYLFMRGTGSIDATQLTSHTLHLSSYSYGNMIALAPDSLLAEIHYYGDIIINGNPKWEKIDQTGMGNYIKK